MAKVCDEYWWCGGRYEVSRRLDLWRWREKTEKVVWQADNRLKIPFGEFVVCALEILRASVLLANT